jgi:SpoVK/Ycf46/Vps4 family AAA+-type ATPase
MKYSIEIGKIIEGAFKHDSEKVKAYSKQLINKLKEDGDIRTANKMDRILKMQTAHNLTAMNEKIFKNIPVDSESRTLLADIIYPYEMTVDVALSKNSRDQIDDFILNYQNADKLNEAGIGVSNTLLLYGPPGCGKTRSAYLIAEKLNLPLVTARLDSIISSYLGTTAKNIRTLFEYIQKMPCVLFLDEFDAIAKARDDSNELGELKRVVNSLLQNIDSLSDDSLMVAATNHDQLLDNAVWRRFDYKITIELPDVEAIKGLIEIFLGNTFELDEKIKYELAYAFEGLSGATIEEIIKKAMRNSIIHNREFSYRLIYNEFFINRKLFSDNEFIDKKILIDRARYLRTCNEKIFSYSKIGDILGVSKSHVSNILKGD